MIKRPGRQGSRVFGLGCKPANNPDALCSEFDMLQGCGCYVMGVQACRRHCLDGALADQLQLMTKM